jgi:DNA-binding NtrC family response regulator
LLYRLKVLHIKVPPLRERREDIPLLAEFFLRRLNSEHKASKRFAPGSIEPLTKLRFAGNIRELQNVIERAFFLSKGSVIRPAGVEETGAENQTDDVRTWFEELRDGRKDFWSAIHDPFKRRHIPREKVVALVDLGLQSTHGSYKMLASVLGVRDKGYRKLMDFLRRNDLLLDFRPYRKAPDAVAQRPGR